MKLLTTDITWGVCVCVSPHPSSNLYSSPSALLGFRWESGVQKVPLSGIGCLRFLTHIPVCTCTHQPLLPTLQTFTLCLVLMHLFPRALTLHSTFLHFVCSAICLKTEIWITWYMYISTVISQMKISGNSKHRFFFFFLEQVDHFLFLCVFVTLEGLCILCVRIICVFVLFLCFFLIHFKKLVNSHLWSWNFQFHPITHKEKTKYPSSWAAAFLSGTKFIILCWTHSTWTVDWICVKMQTGLELTEIKKLAKKKMTSFTFRIHVFPCFQHLQSFIFTNTPQKVRICWQTFFS